MKNIPAACLLSLAAAAGAATIQMPSGCTTPDGMTIDPKKKPMLAEGFTADSHGVVRLGAYGFVVVEL